MALYIKSDFDKMSGPDLVRVYNKLNPKYPVTKFSSRGAGIERIMKFQCATGLVGVKGPDETKKDSPKPKASPAPFKERKLSKKLGVIAVMKEMVKRSSGASMAEIEVALQASFPDRKASSMMTTTRINLNPKLNPGFQIEKTKSEARGVVYRLVAK